MVQPSSSPTGGAVSYLVPGHLPGTEAAFQKKLRPLSSTYVTFSPDGSELLANLGGEQLYLYDRFVLHQVGASRPRPGGRQARGQQRVRGPALLQGGGAV